MKIKYSRSEAKKYAQFAEKSFSWRYLEKPVLVRQLVPSANPQAKVLDAGCGMGRTIKLLLEFGFSEKNIVGSDISPDMLRIAHEQLPKVRILKSDLLTLRCKPNSFDLILCVLVLQYFNQRDLKRIVKKFFCWMNRGGKLILMTVHPFRYSDNYRAYFDDRVKNEPTPWGTIIEYYPKKISDYLNAAIGAGFEILEVEEPRASETGKTENQQEYKKYSSIPTRLVIVARKR